MEDPRAPGFGRLVGGIALFTLLGFPLIAYLWETMNQLLSAQVEGTRLLISLPVLLLFLALLRWLAGVVVRWQGDRPTERTR